MSHLGGGLGAWERLGVPRKSWRKCLGRPWFPLCEEHLLTGAAGVSQDGPGGGSFQYSSPGVPLWAVSLPVSSDDEESEVAPSLFSDDEEGEVNASLFSNEEEGEGFPPLFSDDEEDEVEIEDAMDTSGDDSRYDTVSDEDDAEDDGGSPGSPRMLQFPQERFRQGRRPAFPVAFPVAPPGGVRAGAMVPGLGAPVV
ncbi:hypothetical protein L3Q82_024242, partial [Scortum barcoo]